MKMTVKHSYLIQLANILANPSRIFSGDCQGSVAYKVYMNRNIAKTYLDGFVQAFPEDPKWLEYTQKHDSVYNEANVQTAAQLAALPPEKQAEITERVAAIDAEYKDVIEKNKALELERRKTLDDIVEVDLYTVKPTDIQIQGQGAWEIWDVLYNNGNGIIRDDEAKPAEA
jgi:hypothetical protein